MRPFPAIAALALTLSCERGDDCGAMEPGIARDTCVHGQIDGLTADQVDQVIGLAQQIDDPMIRGAAASTWIAAHGTKVPRQKGETLCQLLAGTDRELCRRRLASAHLQR